MHGNPQTMQLAPMPGDPVPQVLAFLQQRAQALQAHGVQAERIMLDPGIGFGKTVAQNFALLARQGELLSARLPLLIGWVLVICASAGMVNGMLRPFCVSVRATSLSSL